MDLKSALVYDRSILSQVKKTIFVITGVPVYNTRAFNARASAVLCTAHREFLSV